MTRIPLSLLACLALCFFSCQKDKAKSAGDDGADLPLPSDPLFRLVAAAESGIAFQNTIAEDHDNNILINSYLYNGAGVGVLDFNNDGLQDLFFAATTGSCKLYQNEGHFKFRDVTDAAGVAAEQGQKTGVTVVDLNADGWQDLYVCRSGMKANDDRRNLLFINNKNGMFTESAKAYGLDDMSASNQSLFFDYDLDGDLDMYLLNHPTDFSTIRMMFVEQGPDGKLRRVNKPTLALDTDRLYRNEGNGTFTDVSQSAGIWNRAFGLNVLATDVNNDGYPDLYVSNDFIEPDFLYVNNRNGTFTERLQQSFRHICGNSMGADAADLNNDGFVDFVSLDMLAEDYKLQKKRLQLLELDRYTTLTQNGYFHQLERNTFSLNNGNFDNPDQLPTFSEIGCVAGMFQTDWSWSILAQDLDNDGWKDLYITNGYRREVTNADYTIFTIDSLNRIPGGHGKKNFPSIYDLLNTIPEHKARNYALRAKGDLSFEDQSNNWGFVHKSFSNGAAYTDLDNDGDLDIVVNNIEREAFVYQNTSAERKKGNWLQIKLQGAPNNPQATGARVRVYAGGQTFYQELNPTRGYLSSVEPLLHFGLGAVAQIDKIEAEFPGNKLLVQENIPVNQRLTLKIGDAKPGKLPPLSKPTPFIREITGKQGLVYRHKEDEFMDFNRERLLPWKLSTPGPSLAVGDVNGDGLQDFYVGGAAGSAGVLMIQSTSGAFMPGAQSTWDADARFEDTGCAFFDADGDGDQDLFVASGGNSAPAGSDVYQPRLYTNDGKGNFSRNTAALPKLAESGSAVSIHDYDHDGDPDIFLGGWCRPGAYPLAPASYILQNNQGVFTDVTAQASSGYGWMGMVRSMVWSNIDADKEEELIVAGEWMPITIFKNSGGRLENRSSDFALQSSNGFWRSLTVADVDGDGDNDLICGNLGLNTRLRATESSPLEMYAKDFDGNGSTDPLMVFTQNNEHLLVAYRDVIVKQIPALKKKYVRYTPYADAVLDDVYSPKEREGALHLKVNKVESVLLLNQNGRFTEQTLPLQAQIAPIYACLPIDVNGDGHLDLITAGNDYGQQVETGRIDAGNGCVLLGDGKGSFRALYARESGFWATKEARSLLTLRTAGNKTWLLVGNNNDVLQVFELGAAVSGHAR